MRTSPSYARPTPSRSRLGGPHAPFGNTHAVPSHTRHTEPRASASGLATSIPGAIPLQRATLKRAIELRELVERCERRPATLDRLPHGRGSVRHTRFPAARLIPRGASPPMPGQPPGLREHIHRPAQPIAHPTDNAYSHGASTRFAPQQERRLHAFAVSRKS